MDDLRVPIGLLFTIFGVILTIAGIAMPGNHAALTDVNVNLYAGISMLVFGSVMLWLARRAS